jgi:hypothetical protein
MKFTHTLLIFLLMRLSVWSEDFAALCADRAAVERVYYNHRPGTKLPFEQALPRATLERFVRDDLKKEPVLARIYGVSITDEMVATEVRRINATTRTPEILVEIKTALGNDTNRFARTMARPLLVERLLREKFENDDALHAAQREECEQARNILLAARASGASATQLVARLKQASTNTVTETTWQLARRPLETNAPAADEVEIKKQPGSNAKLNSTPGSDRERKSYFEDLPLPLQQVLRAQLRQTGDISAVIEGTTGFILYIAKQRTPATLTTATLFIPKRSYDEWLAQNAPP